MTLLARLIDRLLGMTRPVPTRALEAVLLPPDTSLLTLPKFVPAGFQQGVEILNDNATPMEFVVQELGTHFGLSQQESVRIMLNIHTRGGALLSVPSMEAAEKAAAAITDAARKLKHPLVCRAVRKSS
jgi:ATP-dependent Clp protease adapter protein ClpS